MRDFWAALPSGARLLVVGIILYLFAAILYNVLRFH